MNVCIDGKTVDGELLATIEKAAKDYEAGWPRWFKGTCDMFVWRMDTETQGVAFNRLHGAIETRAKITASFPGLIPIPPAEAEALIAAAREKGRWAVSRWKFTDKWGSVEEYRSSDGGLTQEIKIHYKSGVVEAWKQPCCPSFVAFEITPARARDIMDGWAKAREAEKVRCFEGNTIKYLLRYEGNECVKRVNPDGSAVHGRGTLAMDSLVKGCVTEFPPAEWESRVAALQPDPKSILLDDARLVIDGGGNVLKNNYGPLTYRTAVELLDKIDPCKN